MLTTSAENMLVTSIDTTLETAVVPTQYIVINSTVRRQSKVGIQRWIDVGPIVNFCLGRVFTTGLQYRAMSLSMTTVINLFVSYS